MSNIGRDFKIADFGCGPGLYTIRLAKCGANVTGIDFSEMSIKYAKKVEACEQLNISYVKQNYLEFETGDRFDLVLMIMCDFCIIESGRTSTIYNWLQYFAPEKLGREFMETGFFIEELYSDVPGTPYNGTSNEFAVIAKKL
jgi:SAM-dependent methyltransferase